MMVRSIRDLLRPTAGTPERRPLRQVVPLYYTGGRGVWADFHDNVTDPFIVKESGDPESPCLWVGAVRAPGILTVEQVKTVRDALDGWLAAVGEND